MISATASIEEQVENKGTVFEVLTPDDLALRLRVPKSWIMEQTRSRAVDKIPHLKLGRYVRFQWNSPDLRDWINRRLCGGSKHRQSIC
jgi:hypothetical protein